ncbi:hypothetical protein MBANPS3_003263 [Mucor bainieri]
MTDDWSVNQNPDAADATFSGEASSEGIIYNQLSTTEFAAAIAPSANSSFSSGFVQELCRSVRQVDEAFLADAAMHSSAKQPLFTSVIDDNVLEVAKDNEQGIEQARHEQLLIDEDAPFSYHQLYPNEIELVEFEEIERLAGGSSDVEDHILAIPDNFHPDILDGDEEKAFMFDDDSGKDFSSWLLYDADDNIAAFKFTHLLLRMHLLKSEPQSENASGDNPQTTASASTENNSIVKPSTHLHDKHSKEHAAPGLESQANRASLDERPKSEVANNTGKEDVQQSSSKSLSNVDSKQCSSSSSRKQPRRHSPAPDNNSASEASSSFLDAIVRTSTPNSSKRHSITTCDQLARESPTKKIKKSKYFLNENRNAANEREKDTPSFQ